MVLRLLVVSERNRHDVAGWLGGWVARW
jgi:hypothetical protein